uniref:Protein disulfide-isomerase A6 homolog n=1 Tax=Strigamia maritima TaxID=126957 RepID=T1JB37_STRMM
MLLHIGIFVTTVFSAQALYDRQSYVVNLTPTNFNSKVINSDDVWIVEFFAPWCGHCQNMVPEYEKAAKALKGLVNVGAVNADDHKTLAEQYKVKGFPTIKIFGQNKKAPLDFNGARNADAFVEAAFKALRNLVDARIGKKGGSSGSKPRSSSGEGGDGKDVIELTDGNFEETVLESEDMWLVEFYAPWCGHCKNLAPQWESAASQLKGKVKLGALDATAHTVMGNKYGVRGYPTIKYFASGKKSSSSAEEYDGGRTSADIVQWALDKLAQNIPPPELQQITDAEVLKKSCEGHQICIIAVLPHILDCQSKCRNDYINTLTKLGDKFKKNMWGWLWTEAGSQFELEEGIGIGGFGYPALAAANIRKMKYSLLRGSFSYEGINEFLRELAVGRGSTVPLKGAQLPKVLKVEPWDGKDAELQVEEEDLSDVDLDEGKKKEEL